MVLAAAAAVSLAAAATARADHQPLTDLTWNGALDAPLSDPSNFAPPMTPDDTSNVIINGGRPIVDVSRTIGGLDVLTVGSFGISIPSGNSLDVLHHFNMTGGTVGGAGSLNLGGTGYLTTSTSKTFLPRINLYGTLFAQDGFISVAHLDILASGVLNVSGNQTFLNAGSNSGTINIDGTLGVAGFTNHNIVNINSGSLNLGSNSGGTGIWAADATITLAGNNIDLGGTVQGDGRLLADGLFSNVVINASVDLDKVEVAGSRPIFNGPVDTNEIDIWVNSNAIAQFNAPVTTNILKVRHGGQRSGTATVHVTDYATFDNATLRDAGTTIIQGRTNVGPVTINAHQLHIGGTATQTGNLTFNNNGRLRILEGGAFDISGNASGTGSVQNDGLFRLDRMWTHVWNVPLNNSTTGTVQVDQGTLTLGGVTNFSGGTLQIAEGARAVMGGLSSATKTFGVNSTVQGPGIFETAAVSGATTINGIFNVTGETRINATTTFSSSPLHLGHLTVAGNGNFNAGISAVSRITHQFGSMNITGDVSVPGPYNWTGGTLTGSGTSTVSGDLALSGTSLKTVTNRSVVTSGNTLWTGGEWRFNGTAGWTNDGNATVAFPAGGALMNLLNDATFTNNHQFNVNSAFSTNINTSAEHRFINTPSGVIELGANTLLRVPVNNNGTINVNTGTTTISAPSINAGTWTVGNGAALNFGFAAAVVDGRHEFLPTSFMFGAADAQIRFTGGGQVELLGHYSNAGITNVSSTEVTAGPGHAMGDVQLINGIMIFLYDEAATPSGPIVKSIDATNSQIIGAGDAGPDGPPLEVQSLQCSQDVTIRNLNLAVINELTVSALGWFKVEDATVQPNDRIFLQAGSIFEGSNARLRFLLSTGAGPGPEMSGDWEAVGTEEFSGFSRKGGFDTALAILLSDVDVRSQQRLTFFSHLELQNSTIECNQLQIMEKLTLTHGSTVIPQNLTINDAQGQEMVVITSAISFAAADHGFDQETYLALTGGQGLALQNIRAAPGQSPGAVQIAASLQLISSALSMELGGVQQGISYDHIHIGGTLTLSDSLLNLSIIDGFESLIEAQDVFTLITTEGIIGSFANVASGGRLQVEGRPYSFEVFYGAGSPFSANDVVITGFMIPEPVGLALLLAALPTLHRRRRLPA